MKLFLTLVVLAGVLSACGANSTGAKATPTVTVPELTCAQWGNLFHYNDKVEVTAADDYVATIRDITSGQIFKALNPAGLGDDTTHLKAMAFKDLGQGVGVVVTTLVTDVKGVVAAGACDFHKGEPWIIINTGDPVPPLGSGTPLATPAIPPTATPNIN